MEGPELDGDFTIRPSTHDTRLLPDDWVDSYLGVELFVPGDVTGDGADDLAIFDAAVLPSWPLGAGGFVFPGPLVDRGAVFLLEDGGIPLAWPGPWRGARCGDLDLDGGDDLCLAAGIAFGPVAAGVQPDVTWSGVGRAEQSAVAGCDLDGDGLGELLLWDPGRAEVHHLITFPPGDWDPALLSDRTWSAPGPAAPGDGDTVPMLSGEDLTGDGHDDVALGWYDLDRSAAYVASGVVGGELDAVAHARVELSALALAAGDFDGDAAADLALGAESRVYLFLGPLPAGDLAPAGAQLVLTGEQHPIDLFGWALDAADLDGDGRDDLVVGAPHDGLGDEYPEPAGRVYLFYGGGWRGP